ncbi:35601_t:CDS:1 [Gigaspora margarita]|uniref:35601_t:CDS:1 n=1 Tax=Gigaspora margarita TaxID=4874 RepID=A0ABN7V8V7_GIGMA|nr:35601_t:CDS:1 [Gigaspora margarita]
MSNPEKAQKGPYTIKVYNFLKTIKDQYKYLSSNHHITFKLTIFKYNQQLKKKYNINLSIAYYTMSLPITLITITDLDESDPYYDLWNNVLSGYQTHVNINTNHLQAPTLLLQNHYQSIFNITSFTPWQPFHSLISLNQHFQTEIYIYFHVFHVYIV